VIHSPYVPFHCRQLTLPIVFSSFEMVFCTIKSGYHDEEHSTDGESRSEGDVVLTHGPPAIYCDSSSETASLEESSGKEASSSEAELSMDSSSKEASCPAIDSSDDEVPFKDSSNGAS